MFGKKDFLPSDFIIKLAARQLCDLDLIDTVCGDVIFIICGFDRSNLNMVRHQVSSLSHSMNSSL